MKTHLPENGFADVTVLEKEMPLMKEPNTTKKSVDYFRLPRLLSRKLKKCLPNNRKRTRRGSRPRARHRAVINGICYVFWTGSQWKAVFTRIGSG
jgi:hypothetical protein